MGCLIEGVLWEGLGVGGFAPWRGIGMMKGRRSVGVATH